MRCIFCREERPPSQEHVFPEAIGGTLVIDRVCKPCNEKLGSQVDCKLVDHLACLVVRERLGMTDGEGRPVRSWPKLFRGGVLAADPTQKIEVRQDRETGRFSTKLRHNRRKTKDADGAEHVQIAVDLNDIDQLHTIVQRERKRAGLPPLPDAEIEALKQDARRNVITIENPEIVHQPWIDVEAYKRGIAKIAYEMAWYWLGDVYLDDPRAAVLRDYVLGNRDDLPAARIEFYDEHPCFASWASEPDAHIAIGVSQARSHAIAVRIFNAFIGVIKATAENERYGDRDWKQFLLIEPVTGVQRMSSFDAEAVAIVKREREAATATS